MRVIQHRVSALAVAASLFGWRAGLPLRGIATADAECTVTAGEGRALTDTSTILRLLVNIPAYRLDVVVDGKVEQSIPVAVGQPGYRTPLGHFHMDYVVWNPWWRPPRSAWARKERLTPPGWMNPVGRVKLHVNDLVFMHGSPLERSLGSAASHACVRMSNVQAIALARRVHALAGPLVPATLLDEVINDTTRTTTLVLAQAVPVDIEYALAEVRSDSLVLYRDVYGYAGGRVAPVMEQAERALRSALGDSVFIDLARLAALSRASRRARVGLPLDSLASPAPASAPEW